MTHDEFIEQVGRLRRAYGEKAYPMERVALIWEKFRHRHLTVFGEAISIAIASHLQPPLLDKLRDALKVAQDKYPQLATDPYDETRKLLSEAQANPNACHKCEGHGIIIAYRKDKPSRYQEQLICDCRCGGLARELPINRAYPEWLHYYDHYYVLETDSKASEKLAECAHIADLPPHERMNALVKIMRKGAEMPA